MVTWLLSKGDQALASRASRPTPASAKTAGLRKVLCISCVVVLVMKELKTDESKML